MERVVAVDACGLPLVVRERRLRLVVLGHGRASLCDKCQAHAHQAWFDYGPPLNSSQRAKLVVRQCLSDMGTEFGLADAADVMRS